MINDKLENASKAASSEKNYKLFMIKQRETKLRYMLVPLEKFEQSPVFGRNERFRRRNAMMIMSMG
jgi:hypothetical protein